MDYGPPGFSVHGILQARILEWVAMPSSRGSSRPRDWTHVSHVSCIGRQVLFHSTTWEALLVSIDLLIIDIIKCIVHCDLMLYFNVFKAHPSCSMYQHSIPFYCQRIIHCEDILYFVYSFISWWTLALFSLFDCYEWYYHEHTHTFFWYDCIFSSLALESLVHTIGLCCTEFPSSCLLSCHTVLCTNPAMHYFLHMLVSIC